VEAHQTTQRDGALSSAKQLHLRRLVVGEVVCEAPVLDFCFDLVEPHVRGV
jgi:hypothetical protein